VWLEKGPPAAPTDLAVFHLLPHIYRKVGAEAIQSMGFAVVANNISGQSGCGGDRLVARAAQTQFSDLSCLDLSHFTTILSP
jgi:hypothetical protein